MLQVVLVTALLLSGEQLSAAIPVTSDNENGASVLETMLRAHYPEVAAWNLSPSKNLQHRRRSQWFAQTPTGDSIHRDGNLFSIESRGSGTAFHYRVSGYQSIWTTRKPQSKGTVIREDNYLEQQRDVFSLGCEPFVSEIMHGVLRLRRNLKAREVVCQGDIETVPLVSRSEVLAIRCGNDAVTVSTVAIALSDGMLGQRIQVRRKSINQTLSATVVNQGEADACI